MLLLNIQSSPRGAKSASIAGRRVEIEGDRLAVFDVKTCGFWRAWMLPTKAT
jgi:hypothetical protein